MNGSPLAMLGLLALLFLGSWGWGSALVAVMRRAGWADAAEVVTAPLQMAVGVALFLAFGGFLVAADAAWFWALLVWHVAGVVLLAPLVPAALRRARAGRAAATLRGVVLAVAGAIVALIAVGLAIGFPQYNPLDDDGAYVYLAQRLLGTGGLIDPFSLRRITSYGGSELYQAMFLKVAGNSSLRAFELVFALGVVLAVVVRSTRRRWVVAGTLVLGLGMATGLGIGPVTNLSPEFSVTALSLAIFVLLRHIPHQAARDRPWLYVVIGILLAGVLALRFYFVVALVIAIVLAAVAIRGRRGVRGIVSVAATTVLCTVGWAIALWRSSGTPTFPVPAGDYNTLWPSGANPTLHGIPAYYDRFKIFFSNIHTHNAYPVGWVVVVTLIVGGLCLAYSDRATVPLLVVVGAGLGTLAQMGLVTVVFSGSAPADVDRFVSPTVLACGLLLVDAFWPLRPPVPAPASAAVPSTSTAPAATAPVAPSRRHPFGSRRRRVGSVLGSPGAALVVVVGTLLFLFGFVPVVSGSSAHDETTAITRYAKYGWRVLDRSNPMRDRYAAYEHQYAVSSLFVPPGVHVLAAVNLPGLLDFLAFPSPRSTWPAPCRRPRTFRTSKGARRWCTTYGATDTTTSCPSRPPRNSGCGTSASIPASCTRRCTSTTSRLPTPSPGTPPSTASSTVGSTGCAPSARCHSSTSAEHRDAGAAARLRCGGQGSMLRGALQLDPL